MMAILRRMLWLVPIVAALCLVSWRTTQGAGQSSVKSMPVQIVRGGQPAGGDPGQKGATYYALEGQSIRVTTSFTDGTKAVAERVFDGDIRTRLEDAHGNEVNRLATDHVDGVNDVLQYHPLGGTPVLARLDPAVRQTLDWSNAQSHRLHRDQAVSGTPLLWKGGLMRAAGAAAAIDSDTDGDARAVETQWANGLVANTVRAAVPRGTTYDGRTVSGEMLATTLMRDGVKVGRSTYLVQERVFEWEMPGVSEGVITTAHLKRQYGGWRFTPDLVWMNLQTIATYHWRTLMKEKGTVARQLPRRNPILQFFVPVLAANDEGCDVLHYLDGTIYRPCCDQHDRCYSNYGCNDTTWWWWGGWRCTSCNIVVVACFVAQTGGSHIRHPYGG
jgi:hypothetical protein